jgi:type I restriction enzyme S subunit
MDKQPARWRPVRLDELGTVERGRSRHRPRNDPSLYGGKYPFVQTGDVKAAGLKLYRYTQTYSDVGLAQSRLWPPGTLCITIAANICDTAILGISACFPDSIVGFTPTPGVADVVFVKYALDHAKQRFTGISRGATQDNLSLEKLLSQQLLIPPIEEQRRIASILGAYDDLIEVNRRRIARLEEMARRLFDEIVVRPIGGLPEPGGAGHKIDLPDGWKVEPLGTVARITMGQSPPSAELNTSGSGLAFHQGVTDFGELFPGRRVFCEHLTGKRIADKGDILFSVRAPVGRINCASEKTVLGRGVAAIRDRNGERAYLLAHLRSTFHTTDLIGNGAIYKAVTRGDVERVPIIRAPPQIASKLNGQLEEILGLNRTLYSSNTALVKSRDLLLPRLISGDLLASEQELEAVA